MPTDLPPLDSLEAFKKWCHAESMKRSVYDPPSMLLPADVLYAAFRALQADRERLDWLSRETGGEGSLFWHCVGERFRLLDSEDGQTLRAAIDAARSAEGREGE